MQSWAWRGPRARRTPGWVRPAWIETTTGWSIRKFVRTARRYRTITIQAGQHTITAADPLPDDLRSALAKISNARPGAD
jgi:hypothetical protein